MTAIDRFLASGDPGNVDELQGEIRRLQNTFDALHDAARRAQAALRRHPSTPIESVAEADMILFAVLPERAP